MSLWLTISLATVVFLALATLLRRSSVARRERRWKEEDRRAREKWQSEQRDAVVECIPVPGGVLVTRGDEVLMMPPVPQGDDDEQETRPVRRG